MKDCLDVTIECPKSGVIGARGTIQFFGSVKTPSGECRRMVVAEFAFAPHRRCYYPVQKGEKIGIWFNTDTFLVERIERLPT